MRKSRRTAPQGGFTVIEMLVVLAIASFILSVVLMAIPALQRNSRNSARRDDVQIVLQALSRYALNNSANFPDDLMFLNDSRLSFYDRTSGIHLHPQTSASAGPVSSADDEGRVDIYNYERCNIDDPGAATSNGADYRDVVALYAIETSTGTAPRCQQL